MIKFIQKIEFDSLKILVIINSVIFVIAFLLYRIAESSSDYFEVLKLVGGFSRFDIMDGNFWQLITFNFVHVELIHFGFNIYALYQLGRIVKEFYSSEKLFTTYILGGLMAGLFSFVFGIRFTVGASGAIFALLGLLIGQTLKKDRFGSQLPFTTSDLIVPVVMTFGLSIIPGLNINQFAHLGGFLAGIGLSQILQHSFNIVETPAQKNISDTLYLTSLFIGATSFVFLLLNAINTLFLIS